MRKHPTLPALLSLALILAVWIVPAAAQAPARSIQANPPVASHAVADLSGDYVLVSPGFGVQTCSAKTVPFAAPALFCPHCPPGKVSCGYPLCRCCGGEL